MATSKRMTVPAIRDHCCTGAASAAAVEPLVMVTAYDAPGARIADEAGVDMILVGDSLAMVVLGYEDTLQVTVADIAHHTAAVARVKPAALIVADLPWMSYHISAEETVRNAAELIRAGAQSVKLEGGRKRLPMIEALISAEIPVMGHLGLTPQSVHVLGGYRVQGRDPAASERLRGEAQRLEELGAFSVVLECVPAALAAAITEERALPTIGIGAGRGTSGQVLVLSDLLGLDGQFRPRFVRRYVEGHAVVREAIDHFARDVRAAQFPAHEEVLA